VEAASAIVERWPMDTTDAMEMEYSSKWVLQTGSQVKNSMRKGEGVYKKTGSVYLKRMRNSSR
jgi:hypothetical protein